MISQFVMQRFKCFENQSIIFKPLTLLAGMNATGKSTTIQALLLLRQSFWGGYLERGELLLNGPFVGIGTAKDALYSNSLTESIVFELVNGDYLDVVHRLVVAADDKDGYVLRGDPVLQPFGGNLFWPRFTYLNAERWGPRVHYPVSEQPLEFLNVGVHGEFTAYCLAELGLKRSPNSGLVIPGSPDVSLKGQVRLWMQRFVPGFDVETITFREVDMVQMGLKNRHSAGDWFLRPTNIGFGVSYTLPIVVAALMSETGSMLVVENPEAHLHPAGQSQMGQFLALAAATGLQVVLETHSDHILNGIRLAVKRGWVSGEDVSLQFFTRRPDWEIEVYSPKIDQNGRIDIWPDGFFDQLENDLLELF